VHQQAYGTLPGPHSPCSPLLVHPVHPVSPFIILVGVCVGVVEAILGVRRSSARNRKAAICRVQWEDTRCPRRESNATNT
jgi:hypothetical protein